MPNFGILRSIRTSELELMLTWRNTPSVRKNMYTRQEISIEDHLAWWGKVEKRSDQRYLMYELGDIPSGIVAFTAIDKVNCSAAWAFYASPQAPKGTGSKMEFQALEYAFNILKLHKLYCEVLAFNLPVIKLHQKFGFKVEGIFREQYYYDGKFVDTYRLGLLTNEWSDQRQRMQDRINLLLREAS